MPNSAAPAPSARVTAVVTAFRPDAGLLEVCASVAPQVDAVVVVDDGSGPAADGVLDACAALGATVLRHPGNRGIGAALNTGVSAALDAAGGAPADVLTLDQDSAVPRGYVAALRAALGRARAAGLDVAMVGPGRATGVRAAGAGDGDADGVVRAREPIQSGLLLTAGALRALGPFDAGLFIDGVDTEYWLRARARGLAAVVAPDAELTHRLGRRHEVRLGGRALLSVGHAAEFRYYYIARNRVELVRRFGRREPAWAAGAVLRDLRHLALTTVLVPGRAGRLRETLDGLRDGARRVRGPRPERR
jgi:rhamnosyltransferase